MHIRHLKAGMILAKDVVDDGGNLLLEKGISLTEAYLSRLKQLGITTVHVADSQEAAIPQVPVIPTELRAELADCFRSLFSAETQSLADSVLPSLQVYRVKKAAGHIIAEIEPHLPNILNLQVREPSTDETAHAVNVCVLSVITGLYLKLPRQTLQELALGALLHDVGKLVLPAVTAASDSLAQTAHSQYGRDILLKSNFSSIVSAIAAQHHERYDGNGFPAGLKGTAIHPLSRLVAITSYFDCAITQAAANGIPRTEVIEEMLANGNTAFDLNLLKAFFRTVAIYPVGSLILLNTGQRGYVIKNQANFPLRPQIRLSTQSGQAEINLLHKPTLTIVDWLEG